MNNENRTYLCEGYFPKYDPDAKLQVTFSRLRREPTMNDEGFIKQLCRGDKPIITPEVWAEFLASAPEPDVSKAQWLLDSGKFSIESEKEENGE